MLAILLLLMMAKSSFSQTASLWRTDFVELQRTSCEGPCPVYSVRIYADGHVLWNGRNAVKVHGDATTRVAPAQARKLIEQFRNGGFWDLRDNSSLLHGYRLCPERLPFFAIRKAGEARCRRRKRPALSLQILGLHLRFPLNTHQWIRSGISRSRRCLKQ